MSQARMITASPGLIPDHLWSWTIACTGAGMKGRVASTSSSATGRTLRPSGAPQRPRRSPLSTQVDVVTIKRNDGPARGLVEPVLRDSSVLRHVSTSIEIPENPVK